MMLRFAATRPSTAVCGLRNNIANIRHYYPATTDFIHYGPDGKPVTSKVPIRIGDPEETYVTIPPDVGRALQTASLTGDVSSSSPESLGDRFKLTCSTILKTLLVVTRLSGFFSPTLPLTATKTHHLL